MCLTSFERFKLKYQLYGGCWAEQRYACALRVKEPYLRQKERGVCQARLAVYWGD